MNDTPRRGSRRLFFGLVLIVVGVLFLLQQIIGLNFRNWWAFFILVPAFGSFSSAFYAYRASGRFTEAVRAGIGGGLIILTVAVILLFDLDWAVWWPLMVIVPGLTVFFNGFTLPASREADRALEKRLYRPWTGWVGVGIIYLGTGFLLSNLRLFEPRALLLNWWSVAILIPALGGVITFLRLVLGGAGLGWAAVSTLTAAAVFAVVGSIALFGADWTLLTPVLLIAIGIILLTGVFRRKP
jgi:hypothetical protein